MASGTEIFLAELASIASPTARPRTTLAYAQSLDGSLTRTPGSPTRISSEQSLTFTHEVRAAHDGILVGVGTVLADNPRLNVRRVPGNSPRPIIMDSKLRSPLDAKFLSSHPDPWIATTHEACEEKVKAFTQRGVTILTVNSLPNGWVDPVALHSMLRERGVKSLMVEGGAHIITSFLQHHLADYLIATISMKLLGGLHSLLGLPAGHAAPQLHNWKTVALDDDLIVGGKLLWS